jgi:hypothetical protein
MNSFSATFRCFQKALADFSNSSIKVKETLETKAFVSFVVYGFSDRYSN